MKNLIVIPMTLVFCFLIYLFTVTLPKQVRTTELGNKIWPSIERFWSFVFSTYGIFMLAVLWIHPEAKNLAVKGLFLPALFVCMSFLLLLLLVATLKTLQYFRIIR